MNTTTLAGGAYVTHVDELDFGAGQPRSEALVIGGDTGSRALSQYAIRLEAGSSPARAFPGSEAVLFVLEGAGTLTIGYREFALERHCAAFVAPGEAFHLANAGDEPLLALVTVCPECTDAHTPGAVPDTFDDSHPERVVHPKAQESHATGDRFYRLLVDNRMGCETVTQFLGAIPKSRAPEHYHEYEEAIAVLSGKGMMHTGDRSAPLGPGSLIFLPRRQMHCIECTTDDGLTLVGVFHPSGSPAVRYGDDPA